MTRADLLKGTQIHQRFSNRLMWLLLCPLLVTAGAALLPSDMGYKITEEVKGIIVPGILFGGSFLVLLILGRVSKRHRRESGLNCPGCMKPFLGVSAQIVIASRHCGHCGVRVLDDPD